MRKRGEYVEPPKLGPAAERVMEAADELIHAAQGGRLPPPRERSLSELMREAAEDETF